MGSMEPDDVILDVWSYSGSCLQAFCVLPDGCRDLIVKRSMQDGVATESYLLTDVDCCAYKATIGGGLKWTGFRFKPAVRIDEEGLKRCLRKGVPSDGTLVHQVLPEYVRLDTRLDEALSALAHTRSVASACRLLGVGERTLQRFVQTKTLQSPVFWRSLARVRLCAQTVASTTISLVQAAADHGYADQAHMTREFRRWLGVTPAVFKADQQMQKFITEPGYAG